MSGSPEYSFEFSGWFFSVPLVVWHNIREKHQDASIQFLHFQAALYVLGLRMEIQPGNSTLTKSRYWRV